MCLAAHALRLVRRSPAIIAPASNSLVKYFAYVSMRSLAKETFDPPWGVTHSLKKVGLLSRVGLYTDSMASARAHGSVTKGSLWLSMVEARKSLRLGEPRCYTTRGWKEATKVARKGASHRLKKLVTEPLSAGKGYLGMVAYQTFGWRRLSLVGSIGD